MTRRYTEDAPPNCPDCKNPMELCEDEDWQPRRKVDDMELEELLAYMHTDHTAWAWTCWDCQVQYGRGQYGVMPFVEKPKRNAVPDGQLSLLEAMP